MVLIGYSFIESGSIIFIRNEESIKQRLAEV